MEPLLSVAALKAAFDSMAAAVIVFDAHHTVVYQNAAALALTEIATGAADRDINTVWENQSASGDALLPDDFPARRALHGEVVVNQEIRMLHRQSGACFIWVFSAVPIRDESGCVVRAVVNIRDITEDRQREQQLLHATRVLKETNLDLERFASVVAHDLNEPLRMVGIFSQLLARHNDGRLDEDSQKFLKFVLNGVERMESLIRNLLAFSRVGAETFASVSETDTTVTVAAVLHDLQFTIEEKRATISFDGLPVVHANEALLAQVFQNLISNAVKFCDGEPRVEIAARRQDHEWLFWVKDNGIGIDPDQQARIFELFRRVRNAQAYPGSGIGLAICKRIVEGHRGRIWVESQPRHGSTFYFTLPGSAPHCKESLPVLKPFTGPANIL